MTDLLRSPIVRATLVVLATVVAYWTAFDAGFIWDDDDYITQNPVLRTADGLRQIWLEPTSIPQYYPLVHTTFWIEFQLWGLDPKGYHVVNVLLHALNAVLLLRILERLRVPGALLAALLFALHPVHVESVAWVTERKNVLSATLYLLSLGAWLRWRPLAEDEAHGSSRHFAVAFLLFVGALLSKTVTCSLPAVVLLLVYWKRGRVTRGDLFASAPFFAIGLALAAVTAWLEKVHVKADGVDFAFGAADRVLIAGRAVWFYLGKLLWPTDLTFNYPRWTIDGSSAAQWAFPIAAVLLVVALVLLRHRIGRGPLVAALIFGGSLLPALGFIDVFPMRYSFVADHFAYLASVAVLTTLAVGAARFVAPRLPENAGFAAAAAVLALLGWQTSRQSLIYASHETLWTDTLEKNPASWMSHVNLGKRALDRGELDVAVERLNKALALHETFEMHTNLGVARYSQGDLGAARRHFERAIEIQPDRPEPMSNLAATLNGLGQHEEALEMVEAALELSPENANALATRGQCLHALGRSREALADLERSLALAPQNEPALGIAASVAAGLKQYERAVQYAANAFILSQGSPTRAAPLASYFTSVVAGLPPDRAAAAAIQLFGQLGAPGRSVALDVVKRLESQGSRDQAAAVRAGLRL